MSASTAADDLADFGCGSSQMEIINTHEHLINQEMLANLGFDQDQWPTCSAGEYQP